MFTDYIINGQAHGQMGELLSGCHYDPGLLRPYIDRSGKKCVTVNTGQRDQDGKPIYQKRLVGDMLSAGVPVPVANATTLRKDEWIELDRAVVRAARQRLRAWADLESRSSFGGFNGMAKMILEHETMSDPGEAVVDMDGVTPGREDQPQFQLEGLPLPITHADFGFSSRRLAVSRNTGTPLDTAMAEAAGRRVAEAVEKTLIGAQTGITYGTSTNYGQTSKVYGYTNHPSRITKTNMTTPTTSNGTTQLGEWLTCRDLLYDAKFYGPFMVYHSADYDEFLDSDFKTNSDKSLRQRLLEIEGIAGIRRLDFLTDTFTTIWVQMTPDVARAVNGMEITTVQWESNGGMRVNFKVMCIKVPQLRADYNGNMGLLHATTA